MDLHEIKTYIVECIKSHPHSIIPFLALGINSDNNITIRFSTARIMEALIIAAVTAAAANYYTVASLKQSMSEVVKLHAAIEKKVEKIETEFDQHRIDDAKEFGELRHLKRGN